MAIGIFNRSHYQETLVVRVHPECLAQQKLPPELVTRRLWKRRFEDIRNFERYLSHNGVVVAASVVQPLASLNRTAIVYRAIVMSRLALSTTVSSVLPAERIPLRAVDR